MWQAAHPVARKFPRTAVGRVQRWQELHSFLKRSKTTSPDSLKVGSGSRRARAPGGSGWPEGSRSPGVVGTGAIEKRTCSRVGCSPFGKRVPLCVPERCAMMFACTFWAIVLWQSLAPHVWATTRRSLGLAYIPACAFALSFARGSPRWHVVHASVFVGCASSIPRWQRAHWEAPTAGRAGACTAGRPGEAGG